MCRLASLLCCLSLLSLAARADSLPSDDAPVVLPASPGLADSTLADPAGTTFAGLLSGAAAAALPAADAMPEASPGASAADGSDQALSMLDIGAAGDDDGDVAADLAAELDAPDPARADRHTASLFTAASNAPAPTASTGTATPVALPAALWLFLSGTGVLGAALRPWRARRAAPAA